jgi:hypothetical protein
MSAWIRLAMRSPEMMIFFLKSCKLDTQRRIPGSYEMPTLRLSHDSSTDPAVRQPPLLNGVAVSPNIDNYATALS